MNDELHDQPLAVDQWWACAQPERPAEPFRTCFDPRCSRCGLARRVATRHHRGTLAFMTSVNEAYELLPKITWCGDAIELEPLT